MGSMGTDNSEFSKGMDSVEHVVFAGGDTAGRLFPGLAVAEQLRRDLPGVKISFCGAGTHLERKHVFAAGFAYRGLPCRPWSQSLREVWKFVKDRRRGIRNAAHWIGSENVTAVVGLGGYASLPIARAALQAGIHVALLDQNPVSGRTTRKLSRIAELICVSSPVAKQRLRTSASVQVTGNPVRSISIAHKSHSAHGPRLLVTGGCLGVPALNEWVPRALYKLSRAVSSWRIVHQAGLQDTSRTAELYRKLALQAEVVPFVDDLPSMLLDTDLVICHAGGTTLSELAVYGVPAILLSDSESSGDHQRIHARCFTRAGAAVTIDPLQLCGRLDDELGARILPIVNDANLRQAMAKSMSNMAFPNAAHDVAKAITGLLRSGQLATAA
jgi:UDP-N-acetylglucosamine--N-acetylmuramyl-(pentapeptide) pyrophosphoryl-undecaprenol N-acetylglucosamine transferase